MIEPLEIKTILTHTSGFQIHNKIRLGWSSPPGHAGFLYVDEGPDDFDGRFIGVFLVAEELRALGEKALELANELENKK